MTESRFPTLAHAQANALLLEIGEATRGLKNVEEAATLDLKTLSSQWAEVLQPLKKQLADKEKELLALLKKAKRDLFPARSEVGSDRVDLPSGAVIHSLEEKIRKAKTVTPEKLEELGFPEAVKTVKSVDWDALEDWPDARLFLVGTERKPAEDFAWEVKA